jgi:hypothetical protein
MLAPDLGQARLRGETNVAKQILIPLHRKYVRTCNGCGYEWEVGRGAVRGFMNRRASDARKSIRMGRNIGFQQGPYYMTEDHAQRDTDRSEIDALEEAVSLSARCGISDFSQRPWRKSDAEGT